MGIGSLLLVRDIRRSAALSLQSPGVILLAAWGFGCILAGIFPPDPPGHWDRPPSFSGVMHGAAAMVLFISFPFAAMLLARTGVFRTDSRLRNIAALSAVTTVIFFACLAPAFVNRPPYGLGISERIVLAANIWWLFAALQRLPRQDAAYPRR